MKYLDGESAKNHILREVKDVPHTIRGDSLLITCPFHSSTNRGSKYFRLSINLASSYYKGKQLPVGLFKCWSCGKTGFFNDLIINPDLPKDKLLKAKPLPNAGSSEDDELFHINIGKVFDKEDTLSSLLDVPKFNISKWKGDWRGISEKTLRKMGCKALFDYNPDVRSSNGSHLIIGGATRLLFYVYDSDNEKVAWLSLATEESRGSNKSVLKQKNMKGEWAHTTFMFHEKFEDDIPLVLVEGPYDALRLIQCGIPAISMLGATNWSDEKRDLLASKASHVIILFDGDKAGYKESLKVYESLKDYVPTKRLKLPIKDKKIDPGDMPNKYIKILKNLIKEFVNS